jgi:2OG-Fe(II) oxygenase superfamily
VHCSPTLTSAYRSFAYASEVTNAPNPGLTVEGIGAIGLPLTERDVHALISKCRQSPFGKGSETVVDTQVRNSFELNASQLSFRNSAWNASVNAFVDIIYRELALTCGRQNVVAEPYKLLLYEEGAFFKSHQDSEKTKGMFGTMVVCLPSEHQGGAVVLKHNKDEYIYDSAKISDFGTSFAAWYSDVYHEVQTVTADTASY